MQPFLPKHYTKSFHHRQNNVAFIIYVLCQMFLCFAELERLSPSSHYVLQVLLLSREAVIVAVQSYNWNCWFFAQTQTQLFQWFQLSSGWDRLCIKKALCVCVSVSIRISPVWVCSSPGQGMLFYLNKWFLSLTRLDLKAMTSSLMQAVNYMLLATAQRVRVKRWITNQRCLPMHWPASVGRLVKVVAFNVAHPGGFVLCALMLFATKGFDRHSRLVTVNWSIKGSRNTQI